MLWRPKFPTHTCCGKLLAAGATNFSDIPRLPDSPKKYAARILNAFNLQTASYVYVCMRM